MVSELGTRFRCPCGEWIGLTVTVGSSERRDDGTVVLPIAFDEDQFKQDFSTHLLADPTNPSHYQFVTVADG